MGRRRWTKLPSEAMRVLGIVQTTFSALADPDSGNHEATTPL